MTDPIPFWLADQEYDPAIPIETLSEHPDNPNVGNTSVIAESLDSHGFYGAVLVQKSSRRIIAGNHRYRVARSKGAEAIPGFWLNVDDQQAKSIITMDNQSARLATFDEEKLLGLLQGFADRPGGFGGTGFTFDTYDDLAARLRGAKLMEEQDNETSMNDEGRDNTIQHGGPDSQRYEERGLRDIILVLPNAEADRLAAAVIALRKRWGDDMSQAAVLLRAAETCAELENG